MKVRELMTKDVVRANPESTLEEIAAMMKTADTKKESESSPNADHDPSAPTRIPASPAPITPLRIRVV